MHGSRTGAATRQHPFSIRSNKMVRKVFVLGLVAIVALLVALPVAAAPGQPVFSGSVYGDGQAWGTKFTTVLPAPNGNEQSYDKLFAFTNGAEGQLAVAEAAPGNSDYNGGRWIVYTATWQMENPPVATSYAQVMAYVAGGQLEVTAGSPAGGPPPYFQCPLLPVK
jgi:hypothetical protein